MRKKILVVCMMNSVHSARWLSQFIDTEIDFYIFPSTFFRRVHPLLKELVSSKSTATYTVQLTPDISGYWDYLQERIFRLIFPQSSRKQRLNRFIVSVQPEIIHALEFQHSAYLCSEVINSYGKNFKFIATNWGSDVYHFMNLPEHNTKIREVFTYADKYSAECTRDLKLAINLGFRGEFLPVIPNAGGFALEEIVRARSITSSRTLILVKGYGGYFGRVQLVLKSLLQILDESPQYSVFFYSVTDDVVELVKELKGKFDARVDFSTVQKPISNVTLLELFSKARVYVGCSISDGVSTSFLEALVSGAYPVQTNTSCASEWIEKGAVGSIVNVDSTEISKSIREALSDDDLVNKAQIANAKVALDFLDYQKIRTSALQFYLTLC
jgi:glycosyltransferase involved in cell wall biosynthesis